MYSVNSFTLVLHPRGSSAQEIVCWEVTKNDAPGSPVEGEGFVEGEEGVGGRIVGAEVDDGSKNV